MRKIMADKDIRSEGIPSGLSSFVHVNGQWGFIFIKKSPKGRFFDGMGDGKVLNIFTYPLDKIL